MHTHLFMLKTYISTLSTFIPQAVVASSRTTWKIRKLFKNYSYLWLLFYFFYYISIIKNWTILPAWIQKYFLCRLEFHEAFLFPGCFSKSSELTTELNGERFLHWLRKQLHLTHGNTPQHPQTPLPNLLWGPNMIWDMKNI